MRIEKRTLKGSPFVGVFACVTEEIGLFPFEMQKKEIKKMEEFFEIEAIQTSIAGSSLIGALSKGNSKGFVLPEIAEREEVKMLEKKGIKVKVVKGVNALGNLIALNDFGIVLSPLIPEKTAKEIISFYGIPHAISRIARTEIVGSCVVATNKGMIVHPNTTADELKNVEKVLKVKGAVTTANYGDPFIANDILANSKAAVVGEQTSPFEMLRIDEGLGNE